MHIIASILLILGAFFILSSIIGLIRMPDIYTKTHAAALADSLGIPLCLIGLAFLQPNTINIAKIIVILILFFILSPTNSHALILAAWKSGLKPYKKK